MSSRTFSMDALLALPHLNRVHPVRGDPTVREERKKSKTDCACEKQHLKCGGITPPPPLRRVLRADGVRRNYFESGYYATT